MPFASGVFRHEMGLKTLDLSEWIDVDENWQKHTELKTRLLTEQRSKVFQAEASARPASEELKILLHQHLKKYFPQLPLKERPSEHPLVVLSEWVQEDFCLMKTEGDEAKLEAGCVCFPSRWKLIEKVGKNMQGIHKPVPGFNQTLEKASTRFLLNTSEDKPTWRLNWTLHTSDEMFAYPEEKKSDTVSSINLQNLLQQTFLRVERQTLRRLPQSGYVVFTIRTYVESLSKVLKTKEDFRSLFSTLESMPKEIVKYKGMEEFIEPLIQAIKKKC